MRSPEMGGFPPESEKKEEGLTELEKIEWDELRNDPDVIKYYKQKDEEREDSSPLNHPDLQEKFEIIKMLEEKAGIEFIPEEEDKSEEERPE